MCSNRKLCHLFHHFHTKLIQVASSQIHSPVSNQKIFCECISKWTLFVMEVLDKGLIQKLSVSSQESFRTFLSCLLHLNSAKVTVPRKSKLSHKQDFQCHLFCLAKFLKLSSKVPKCVLIEAYLAVPVRFLLSL